jgi:hypothetical protein
MIAVSLTPGVKPPQEAQVVFEFQFPVALEVQVAAKVGELSRIKVANAAETSPTVRAKNPGKEKSPLPPQRGTELTEMYGNFVRFTVASDRVKGRGNVE